MVLPMVLTSEMLLESPMALLWGLPSVMSCRRHNTLDKSQASDQYILAPAKGYDTVVDQVRNQDSLALAHW
jgi:hypothetical protein